MLRRTPHVLAIVAAGLSFSACSDETPTVAENLTVQVRNTSVTPALIKSLVPGVEIYSLLSSDDVLPNSPSFVFGGSADGAGVMKNADGTYTALVNHEDNFAVSRIRFDDTFKPVSGEYVVNSTTGRYRMCSASLATFEEHGFSMYLTAGESSEESQILAVNPTGANNSATFVTAMGRWNAENAVPLPKTAYPGKTAILIGDDDSSAEGGQVALYLANAVGDLNSGKVYVLARTDNVTGERQMTLGTTYNVEFREIPNIATLNGRQVNEAAAQRNALALGRVEDLDYRKDGKGREIYFVSTGQPTTGNNAAYTRTKYGRAYRLIMSETDPLKGTLELLLDGDDRNGPARTFQNLDNVFAGQNFVYFQEDDNGYGDEAHDAYVYQYNIATREIRPVLELDHRRDQADYRTYTTVTTPPAKAGWEYGAMIDISNTIGKANTFMIAIQPHHWRGTKYQGVDGGTLRPNENQASQLVIVRGLPR